MPIAEQALRSNQTIVPERLNAALDLMNLRSAARKHHYVPQAFLAGFTEQGTKGGHLYVLAPESGMGFRTIPRNVAAERDFNRVDIEGEPIDVVEKALAAFEGEAIESIRRVVESEAYPDEEDYVSILNLLGLLAIRNPKLRKSFNQSREAVYRRISELLVSDKRVWEHHKGKAIAGGYEISEGVSFEDMRDFVERGDYDIIFSPEGNSRVEFRAFDGVLESLGQRTWSVVLAPEDGPQFICADHPVTLWSRSGSNEALGFGLKNTEVFLPLSKRVGFYGVYEEPLKEVVRCRASNVAIMNQRAVAAALRHVFSASPSFVVWQDGSIREVSCIGNGRK